MPERYLQHLTKDEQHEFFQLLAKKEGRIAALTGTIVAVIIACAIVLPTSIVINQNTNSVNQQNYQKNCRAIKALRDIDKDIIIKASKGAPGGAASEFTQYSLRVLDTLNC